MAIGCVWFVFILSDLKSTCYMMWPDIVLVQTRIQDISKLFLKGSDEGL